MSRNTPLGKLNSFKSKDKVKTETIKKTITPATPPSLHIIKPPTSTVFEHTQSKDSLASKVPITEPQSPQTTQTIDLKDPAHTPANTHSAVDNNLTDFSCHSPLISPDTDEPQTDSDFFNTLPPETDPRLDSYSTTPDSIRDITGGVYCPQPQTKYYLGNRKLLFTTMSMESESQVDRESELRTLAHAERDEQKMADRHKFEVEQQRKDAEMEIRLRYAINDPEATTWIALKLAQMTRGN